MRRRDGKLRPLLDTWQKPEGAGDPVGVLATTFTFDPDFFQRDCLARFLAVSSVDEGSGSATDLVAALELEERLGEPTITVLADRSSGGERSSLRWDLLTCRLDKGLFHAKAAILLWERVTRVIVGSANLTPAGYRFNIEMAICADLGPDCIFPREVLLEIAGELRSYLALVPGLGQGIPAWQRAQATLDTFEQRVADQQVSPTRLSVALAPTNPTSRPLEVLPTIWRGSQPLGATHVSPFWDTDDSAALTTVAAMLTGRPAAKRRHLVAVHIGPDGQTGFPAGHAAHINDVVELGPLDENPRPLHAKCLVIHSSQWVAALVGSSNHSKAGLGLAGGLLHRELNVWLSAPLDSKEGAALRDLIPCGSHIDVAEESPEPADEDEPGQLDTLPGFFGLCRLSREGSWTLTLTFDSATAPRTWKVSHPDGKPLLDSQQWRKAGAPPAIGYPVEADRLPMFLTVDWDEHTGTWVVIADNRHDLPEGPGLSDLRSSQLLAALAAGKSAAQIAAEALEREQDTATGTHANVGADPLKRFDSASALLRHGRMLAAAMDGLQRRLSHPATSPDALEARLSGPLGPCRIAAKVVAERMGTQGSSENRTLTHADAMFILAEIALVISRVPWQETLQYKDSDHGLRRVEEALDELEELRTQLGADPADLASYSERAIGEARRCLNC